MNDMRWHPRTILIAAAAFAGSACDFATDPATRLAYDIKAGVQSLANDDGAIGTIHHATPSNPDQCAGPYKVQLDQVGAMILWCKDAAGETVSSHSTTYHSKYVKTPRTYLLDKPAGEALIIGLERRGGQAVIVEVR